MSKFLERPILRTLPIFYAQATATTLRRIVFSILALCALINVLGTFLDWQHNNAPLALSFIGFIGSLCLSVLFIGLVAVVWDWLAQKSSPRT